MRIVTFTTDLGTSDYYLAALKGAIYTTVENVTLQDICVHINKFDIKHAAYIIGNAFKYFPQGSIHVVHVDAAEARGRLVCASVNGHYFIGFDNGVIPLALRQLSFECVLVKKEIAAGRSLLRTEGISRIIDHLMQGKLIKEIADEGQVRYSSGLNYQQRDGYIRGSLIYIDSFYNAISDIQKSEFEKYIGDRNFEIQIGRIRLQKIHRAYFENQPPEPIAFFNQEGFLEIASNRGKAVQLFGLRRDMSIFIEALS